MQARLHDIKYRIVLVNSYMSHAFVDIVLVTIVRTYGPTWPRLTSRSRVETEASKQAVEQEE
jgi:hypothetical protein